MQMVMVGSVVGVLAEDFVPLQIIGHPTTEMIQMGVVEDVVCPGVSTSDIAIVKKNSSRLFN